jgi:hypothetical protein
MNSARMLTDQIGKLRSRALSPACFRVLQLLERGSAYRVREAWRVRGSRRRVHDRTIDTLLDFGLAERIETDRFSEIRITPSGRALDGGATPEFARGRSGGTAAVRRNTAGTGWFRMISAIRQDPIADGASAGNRQIS